jgi:hypothetical protein
MPAESVTPSPPVPAGQDNPGRSRLRRAALFGIALLYLVSVPWYRSEGGELRLLWGLPDWVAVALFCYVGVAVLNALAWSLTDVVDPPAADDPNPGPEAR